jgi:hypothetical protein
LREKNALKNTLQRLSLLGVSLSFFLFMFSGCGSKPEKPDTKSGEEVKPGNVKETNGLSAQKPGEAGPGEKVKAFDLNKDNKPDVWAFYGSSDETSKTDPEKAPLLRKEWDFNFDGRVDIRRYFGPKAEILKDQLDLDFDGKFDVSTFYQAGKKVRQEYDFNFDTKPDYWKYFENDVLVRTERDRDFNGRVDRWEYYLEGKLDRIGLDEDGDGQIDKWIQQPKD